MLVRLNGVDFATISHGALSTGVSASQVSSTVTSWLDMASNHVTSFLLAPDGDKSGGGFMDWLNDVADKFVGTEVEYIFKPIWGAIKAGLGALVTALNLHSVEIITLGVIGCSIGMIVGPLMGSSSSKWLGRTIFVMLVGSVWRLLIS